MDRHEVEFQLDYSIIIEEMQLILMGRADRFLTFFQFLLGSAAAGDIFSIKFIGFVVAICAALQFVYQPASKAMEAKIQRDRYLLLKKQSVEMSTEQLDLALKDVLPIDSIIPNALCHPAWLATCLQQGRPIEDHVKKMTWMESFLSWLASRRPVLDRTSLR